MLFRAPVKLMAMFAYFLESQRMRSKGSSKINLNDSLSTLTNLMMFFSSQTTFPIVFTKVKVILISKR